MVWYLLDTTDKQHRLTQRLKAMERFVRCWQGLVQVGQPWSREGTALCMAGTLWSDQRALAPTTEPSLSPTTPAPLLHISAGRKQPSLVSTEDDGAPPLHSRCSEFCPHSLTWAITAPSQFILITEGNIAGARILMPWLASQEPCSLGDCGGCPVVPVQPRDILDWVLRCTGVMAHLKSQGSSRPG